MEESWNHGLTFENLSFVKKYRVGRLSMALYLNFAGHSCKVQYSALTNHQGAIGKNHWSDFGVNVCQSGDGNCRNQQSVLVNYIETVQTAEGAIPSVVIGSYDIKEDGYDVGTCNPNFSPINGCSSSCLVSLKGKFVWRDGVPPAIETISQAMRSKDERKL